MGQRAPSTAQIAVAVAFAFSCFGLLLFLWSAFGGPVPFAPKGYRVNVPFNEATQLAVESDVRISNVSVGRVKKIEIGEEGTENSDLAVATIEIDEDYAPIPEDTLAMLRQKTLLGETYVELTQGSKDAPKLAEDGSLPTGPGRRVGAARRDLPHLRRAHPRRLPDVDAAGGARLRGSRFRRLGGDRQSRAPGRGREQAAAGARHSGGGGRAVRQEHRGRLQRPLGAPGPVARADPELGNRVRDDGAAQRGPGGGVQGAADVPRRVTPDARTGSKPSRGTPTR